MNVEEASEAIMKRFEKAIKKPVEETISIKKDGELWLVEIEILEEAFLPKNNVKSASDIIGVYEVSADAQGELLTWKKLEARKREMVGRQS